MTFRQSSDNDGAERRTEGEGAEAERVVSIDMKPPPQLTLLLINTGQLDDDGGGEEGRVQSYWPADNKQN